MGSLLRAVCLALLLVVAPSAAALSALGAENASPQASQNEQPFGIALEGVAYPYPVKMLPLAQEGERLRMAYMDVAPKSEANGRTALLLHGRNFPSSYWQGVIEALVALSLIHI